VIAIDTNVLLRHAVQDDPVQSPRASRLLRSKQAEGQTVFVSKIVVCEAVWTLRHHYRYAKSDILLFLGALFAEPGLEVEDEPLAVRASDEYRKRARGDFPDYWIGETGAARGCGPVYTFDLGLRNSPRFRVL
jgi:predicted nucleic-acid-binding protein